MPFSATRDLWLVLKARDEASRAMRSFQRDIRQVGDTVRMANLQAARSALINQQAMNRLSGATQQQMMVTQRRIAGIDKEIGLMRTVKAEMEEQRVSAQRLSGSLSGVAGVFGAIGTAATAASFFGAAGLKNLIDSAIEYQKQANLTRTQVDKFGASLRDIEDIGLRVARSVGVSFEQIQPALFDIFSSMEVNAQQAEELLTTFSKAAVAGQTSIQAAGRATIGILNAFQLPVTDVNRLMDLQFQLVQEGIGTYEEWAQRIGLVTPSAVRAGQSVETMLAALAATTRMGISAARSGTAVARAFDAMSHPVSVKNMKELGVNALDAKGKFRPLIDVLGELRASLAKLPEAKRTAALLDVFKGAGGTIEARRFLQNMLLTPGNLELFKNIFEEMKNESGSFEKAYSIMADSASTKSQLLSNQWQALKIAAGEALMPTFMSIVAVMSRVVEWFNKLDPKTQKLITNALAIGVAVLGVVGVFSLLLAGLAAFVATVVVAGSALWIFIGAVAALAAGFVTLGGMIYLAWQKSADFRQTIRDLITQFKKFRDEYVIPLGISLKNTWNEHMKPALDALAKIIEERVMPIWRELTLFLQSEFLSQIKEVANTIKDKLGYAMRIIGDLIEQHLVPMIQKATQFYHEHEETIKQIISVLIEIGKWVLKIGAWIALVFGGTIAVVLVGSLIVAINTLMIFVNHIITVVDWFKKMWKEAGEVIDKIKAAFDPAVIKGIGQALIDGFIGGIKSKFDEAKGAITGFGKNALQWLKDAVGAHSPSVEFMKIGKMSAQGYIKGLNATLPAMKNTVTAMAGNLTNAASSASNGGRSVNQTINVYTNEIDPRRNSAELGWLLGGRT